jgi:hypothetical protein
MSGFPQGHAVVIGVGDYIDTQWNVPVATDDAQAIHAALIDPARAGYAPGNVDLITGTAATRAGLRMALKQLAARVKPTDTVLISFTGHGAPGTDRLYYLATHDMVFDGQQITSDTGLSSAELGLALRDIHAARVVVLLNACFAGSVAQPFAQGGIAARPQRIGAMLNEAQNRQLLQESTAPTGGGRAIITASRPDQLSRFRTDLPRSFFTEALLAALAGGDGIGARSGLIGLFELYTFIHERVLRLTEATPGGAQEPQLTLFQGEGNFAVAAYPGGTTTRPEQLQAAPPSTIQFVGRDSIVAHAGSTVNIDNRQEAPLISFGNNSSIGDIRIGDVARGDIIKTYGAGTPADEPDEIDPAKLLPRLAREIGQARNVDENIALDVVDLLNNASSALASNRRTRALSQVEDALVKIAPLRSNGYINSRARKLEQVRDSLAGTS